MYRQQISSATSLSDYDEDDDDKTVFASSHRSSPTVVPAKWSYKIRTNTKRISKRSPISHLPPEVLIHILKLLYSPRDITSALRVSRTWCECSVELLWHKPAFPRYETVQKMARLLAKPRHTFTYPSFIRRLNFLTLGAHLTDDVFSAFARCDRLERLTLVGCEHISGDALTRIFPCFPNLVAVDLTGVVKTTNEAIIALALSARRLQGINLAACGKTSDEGVMALAENCPLLRRVKLSGLATLTDTPVSLLAKRCPLLLEIDLNQCLLITDIAIRDIWTYSTHMREMRVSHCPLLTDSAFPACSRSDAILPPDAPDPFPCSTPNNVTDLPPLILTRTMEHLRMLDMTACALVTDDAIEGIISHSPKIRNLVLSKCVLLTDRSVENICRLGRHLHYLHLGHAAKITDRSIRTLARSCTRLRYVDFANCLLLTDMSVFELSALPKLRRVGLVRVSNLTDEAIYSLAERHASLERIHLSYCDQISVMAIHFLLQKLHKLTHLSLTGVPAFRQPELQQFCREPPREFNSTQQLSFCVYSGRGVSQLRAFLTELFDHITELNGTDDTEYEDDDDDDDAYLDEDTPEPETGGEGDDDDEVYVSRRQSPDLANVTHRDYRSQSLSQNLPHEFVFRRDRSIRGPTIPSTLNTTQLPPSANIQGATSRLNAQILAAYTSPGPPSPRPRGQGQGLRSMADMLPIIESSVSPPPSDIASNRSEGASQSNRGGPGGGSSGDIGALPLDLNLAEIGYDRGTDDILSPTLPPRHLRRGRETIPDQRQPFIDIDRRPLPRTLSPLQAQTENIRDQASPNIYQYQDNLQGQNVVWPYREPNDTSSPLNTSTRDLEPVQPVSGTDGRGRSAKRSFRNTLNVAEHYASSFLFGRPPNGPDDGNISNNRANGSGNVSGR